MRSWELEFRLLAWPLLSVFIKAKLRMPIRITKVDWPTAISPIAHKPMLPAVAKSHHSQFANVDRLVLISFFRQVPFLRSI